MVKTPSQFPKCLWRLQSLFIITQLVLIVFAQSWKELRLHSENALLDSKLQEANEHQDSKMARWKEATSVQGPLWNWYGGNCQRPGAGKETHYFDMRQDDPVGRVSSHNVNTGLAPYTSLPNALWGRPAPPCWLCVLRLRGVKLLAHMQQGS